jgi:predicted RNase H-like nuclease
MRLAGVDLAWKPDKNGTAVAVGSLDGDRVNVEAIHRAVVGLSAVVATILADEPFGVAVDGPLIINNIGGQRACEKALTRRYGARRAGCHACNQTRYPDAATVALSRHLATLGYRHLATAGTGKYQIEIYPHPALIEMFDLPQRLSYKKGDPAVRRTGQIRLAGLLRALRRSAVLQLIIPNTFDAYLDPATIATLQGAALKANEDALDALVCLYVCALYAHGAPRRIFGDETDGYIVVPSGCVV